MIWANLREHSRMSIEEVLVEYRVVVGERLSQARQARSGYLLQGRLVCLVSYAADVDDDSIFGIRGHDEDCIDSSTTATWPLVTSHESLRRACVYAMIRLVNQATTALMPYLYSHTRNKYISFPTKTYTLWMRRGRMRLIVMTYGPFVLMRRVLWRLSIIDLGGTAVWLPVGFDNGDIIKIKPLSCSDSRSFSARAGHHCSSHWTLLKHVHMKAWHAYTTHARTHTYTHTELFLESTGSSPVISALAERWRTMV